MCENATHSEKKYASKINAEEPPQILKVTHEQLQLYSIQPSLWRGKQQRIKWKTQREISGRHVRRRSRRMVPEL